jgi:hypothetical protein
MEGLGYDDAAETGESDDRADYRLAEDIFIAAMPAGYCRAVPRD